MPLSLPFLLTTEVRRQLITQFGYRDDELPTAAERLLRVLTNDPGTGVMRHVDAGYAEALACAQEQGVKIPMMENAKY